VAPPVRPSLCRPISLLACRTVPTARYVAARASNRHASHAAACRASLSPPGAARLCLRRAIIAFNAGRLICSTPPPCLTPLFSSQRPKLSLFAASLPQRAHLLPEWAPDRAHVPLRAAPSFSSARTSSPGPPLRSRAPAQSEAAVRMPVTGVRCPRVPPIRDEMHRPPPSFRTLVGERS
jgi:hypothetical protein